MRLARIIWSTQLSSRSTLCGKYFRSHTREQCRRPLCTNWKRDIEADVLHSLFSFRHTISDFGKRFHSYLRRCLFRSCLSIVYSIFHFLATQTVWSYDYFPPDTIRHRLEHISYHITSAQFLPLKSDVMFIWNIATSTGDHWNNCLVLHYPNQPLSITSSMFQSPNIFFHSIKGYASWRIEIQE